MFGLPFCLIFIFSHLSGVFSAEESAFRVPLYHRIFNPTSDPERFTERGILHYNGTALWIDTSPHFKEEMQGLTERSNKGGQEMLYQLALDNRPDSAISSVRACHLHTAESDYLTVHVNSESVPFALDYFLSSVPQDGQCKKGRKIKPGAPLTKDTSIFIRKPTFVKEPELRPPPQAEHLQKVQEKPFLQKYWFYIVIAVIALLMSGAAPEEGAANGQAQAAPSNQ